MVLNSISERRVCYGDAYTIIGKTFNVQRPVRPTKEAPLKLVKKIAIALLIIGFMLVLGSQMVIMFKDINHIKELEQSEGMVPIR